MNSEPLSLMVSLFFYREAKGATQRASWRPTAVLDKRRINRGPATCMEQKNDHQPSFQNLWHTLQLASHVRPRQIR